MRSSEQLAADTLSATLVAVPLSWWLGLEQAIPGLVLALGCFRLWRRGALVCGAEARLFGLLLLWSLTSTPALEGPADWVLYLRGEVHLLIGLAAYLVAQAINPSDPLFGRYLKLAMLFIAAMTTLSVLVLTGVLPLEFRSPGLVLWPGLEGSSDFVDDFVLRRRLGTSIGMSLIPGIERQSLFFLYQGDLATALLVLGGWMLSARHRLTGAWRRWVMVAIALSLILVVLTGSRLGTILCWATVLGLILWTTIAGRSWRRWAVRGVVLVLLVGGVAAVIPHADGTSLSDEVLDMALVNFRTQSFLDRVEIYTQTVERLGERPLTGWGIQGRPGERSQHLRLGTHSELLNIAYRFGWVGLALLLATGLVYLRRLVWHSVDHADKPIFVSLVAALSLTALVRTFQWDLNVFWLVMAFLGTSTARPPRAAPLGRSPGVAMLGVVLHPRTVDELRAEIAEAVISDRQIVIGHQNLHGMYLLENDPAMREFAARADIVFFDGMALIWLARGLGHEVGSQHRVTYADWLGPLAAECARRGWRLFHLGGRPGVGERAQQALEKRYPGLEMATFSGYFEPAEVLRIRTIISEFAPQILMVGMGMPHQEAWVVENVDMVNAKVILTCGACMDYVAGAIPTPPRWAGRVGLEWLFRLIREPRRLAFRYLVEPWPVAWRFFREWSTRDWRG